MSEQKRIGRSIWIDAPADFIDNIGLDPDTMPEWFPGVKDTIPDDTFPEEGGAVQIKYGAAGMTFDMTQRVIEREPGRKAVLEQEGMVTGTSTWTYTDEDGGTRVKMIYFYDPPKQFGGMVEGIVNRMSASNIEDMLRNLKEYVEKRYSSA